MPLIWHTFSSKFVFIIVNKIGILANLYKFSATAYIGGGFSRGVHSVLEPAIYNCKIAFGPNIEILDEAQQLIDTDSAYMIHSSNDLLNFLNMKFKNINTTFFDNPNISQSILNQILDSNE